jgi:hypothetical protein
VPEDSCPKCKNRPADISQYPVIHGNPRKGENWEKVDVFRCTRCGGTWKVNWDMLPKYEACKACHTVHFCYPHFRSIYKGTLRGSSRPGLNLQQDDIFRCPACGTYFYISQQLLPDYHTCPCGKRYYCYKSTYERRVDKITKKLPFLKRPL